MITDLHTDTFSARIERYVASINVDVPMTDLRVIMDEATRTLRLNMERRILALDDAVIEAVTHRPLDWWQYFKARWFPMWALRRWPLQSEKIVVVIKVTRMCPHVAISDTQREHFRFLAYGEGVR